MNGNPWTKAEIGLLVDAAEARGCVEALAQRLQRSSAAVQSKAAKLGLNISESRAKA